MKRLLDLGANPNIRDSLGTNLITKAVYWKPASEKLELVDALVKAGADIHMPSHVVPVGYRNGGDVSAFMEAIGTIRPFRQPRILDLMLQYQSRDDCPDVRWIAGLKRACRHADFDEFSAMSRCIGKKNMFRYTGVLIYHVTWRIRHQRVDTVKDAEELLDILAYLLRLFVPSTHDPNLKALRKIVNLSKRTFRKEHSTAPLKQIGMSWYVPIRNFSFLFR
jgi:hypothetical protein